MQQGFGDCTQFSWPLKYFLTFIASWYIFNHMVEYSTRLDDIFHSLADPTRRDMLRRLRPGQQTVGELAERYSLTFAAISKHVQVLERAKLVHKRKKGREQQVELSPNGLKQADNYLEQYRHMWEDRLDKLETFLANKKYKENN